MEEEKDRCYICNDKFTRSYFLGVKDVKCQPFELKLVEVCPDCHHHFTYSPPDILEQYKKRRGIQL